MQHTPSLNGRATAVLSGAGPGTADRRRAGGTLPLTLAVGSVLAWGAALSAAAAAYRAGLAAVLPGGWVHAQAGVVGSPGRVAATLAAVLTVAAVAAALVRRWGVRAWAEGDGPEIGLRVWCHSATAALVPVALAGPASVVVAAALAAGWGGWSSPWGTGPVLAAAALMTVAAATAWSARSTPLLVTEAGALRHPPVPGPVDPRTGWWLAADGHWQPPRR